MKKNGCDAGTVRVLQALVLSTTPHEEEWLWLRASLAGRSRYGPFNHTSWRRMVVTPGGNPAISPSLNSFQPHLMKKNGCDADRDMGSFKIPAFNHTSWRRMVVTIQQATALVVYAHFQPHLMKKNGCDAIAFPHYRMSCESFNHTSWRRMVVTWLSIEQTLKGFEAHRSRTRSVMLLATALDWFDR